MFLREQWWYRSHEGSRVCHGYRSRGTYTHRTFPVVGRQTFTSTFVSKIVYKSDLQIPRISGILESTSKVFVPLSFFHRRCRSTGDTHGYYLILRYVVQECRRLTTTRNSSLPGKMRQRKTCLNLHSHLTRLLI